MSLLLAEWPAAPDRTTTIGLARLMRMAYCGDDLGPVWAEAGARLQADPEAAAALMDMSTILQLTGQRDRGLQFQQAALTISRVYRRPHGAANRLKVLALVVAGDFMANTPLDFLLEGSDFELTLVYLQPGRPSLAAAPEHDVCFLAVCESPGNQAMLAAVAPGDRAMAAPGDERRP